MHQYPPQPKQEFWQPYLMQPQQPQQPPKRNIGKFFAIICGALVLLIIIIAAIVRVGGSSPSSGNNPAMVGQRLTAVTPAGIQIGPQPCPSAVQSSCSLGDDHGHECYTEGGGGTVRLPDGRSLTTSRGQGSLWGH